MNPVPFHEDDWLARARAKNRENIVNLVCTYLGREDERVIEAAKQASKRTRDARTAALWVCQDLRLNVPKQLGFNL